MSFPHEFLIPTQKLTTKDSTLNEPLTKKFKLEEEQKKNIGFIYSKSLCEASDSIPCHSVDFKKRANRNGMVYRLLEASDLLSDLSVVTGSTPATVKQVLEYHSKAYIEALVNCDFLELEELQQFNLVEDGSPFFKNMLIHALWIAGSSLFAVTKLLETNTQAVVNIFGGRHHAKRDQAAGMCFINDVVLSVLELQEKGLENVVVIDLDVHHGDGTKEAFQFSDTVTTCSFHIFEPGFYPGSGKSRIEETNIDVGLSFGTSGADYFEQFSQIFEEEIQVKSDTDCYVLVLGADALKGDPKGGLNLTKEDYIACVEKVSKHCEETTTKLLILGAGGYDFVETAKLWVGIIGMLLGEKNKLKGKDIPSEMNGIEYFAPDFIFS